MANVELIIKISEELYDLIQDNLDFNAELEQKDIKTLMLSIDDGVPLPKGHGRLIDADKLKSQLQDHHDFYISAYDGFKNLPQNDKARVDEITASIASVVNAITILEADKIESKEEGKIIKDETDNFVEIGLLEIDTTIEVGGIQMEILDCAYVSADRKELGVFCLAKDILFEKAFDEYNINNWEKSSLREYLNGEYKDNLPDELREALIPFNRNLLTDDGMKCYGICTDLISLMSEREYQNYRGYISNKSDWWWTLTAWSASFGDTHFVRFVRPGATLGNYDAHYGYGGVSPTFLLLPSLKVKIVKSEE